MTVATNALQVAIVSALKADAAVSSLAGSRVFDFVPRGKGGTINVDFPMVAIGATDERTEDDDCADVLTIDIDVECWSRKLGFPEVRALSGAVRAVLHDASFDLGASALVMIRHVQTSTFRDQDGLSSHAVLTFSAVIEQN